MACRVGISVQPYHRIAEWKKRERHLTVEVLAWSMSYEDAFDLMRAEAQKRGCSQEPDRKRVAGKL